MQSPLGPKVYPKSTRKHPGRLNIDEERRRRRRRRTLLPAITEEASTTRCRGACADRVNFRVFAGSSLYPLLVGLSGPVGEAEEDKEKEEFFQNRTRTSRHS